MNINALVGLTLSKIQVDEDQILFITACGRQFRQWHSQDCCESVEIDDVCGNWDDLIGTPILTAEESCNDGLPGDERPYAESETWTFYRLSTFKGTVVVRWYGESNGYYSEGVDFDEVTA